MTNGIDVMRNYPMSELASEVSSLYHSLHPH